MLATIEGPINCTDGDLRLYGGSQPNTGILQICQNKAWTTVCSNNYYSHRNLLAVACYQLEYTAFGL